MPLRNDYVYVCWADNIGEYLVQQLKFAIDEEKLK